VALSASISAWPLSGESVDSVSRIIHTSRRLDRIRPQGLQDDLTIERITDHDLGSSSGSLALLAAAPGLCLPPRLFDSLL
jgi:hypothetical protein